MLPDEPTPPPQPILRATHRDVDLRRDALAGDPAEQERHRIARVVLLQRLYDPHLAEWCGWCERGPLAAVCAEAMTAYDILAQAAGLPDRGALWREERYRAQRDAIYVRWVYALATLLDQYPLVSTAANTLATKVGLPVPWLSLELQGMILGALAVYTTGKGFHLGFERDVLDTTLHLRLQPGESEATFLERARVERLKAVMAPTSTSRMPKDQDYIKQNVTWLVRHRLDGISIGQLAREYKVTKPDLAADGRPQVREGIVRADAWLNAVAPEAKVLPDDDDPLAGLPPLVREMAERLPHTPETVAGLKGFMRQVAQGPRPKKASSKTKAVHAQRKRNRRR